MTITPDNNKLSHLNFMLHGTMPKKKEKKGVGGGGPFTDTTNLIPQGSFPAREITLAATDPSLFAGEFPPEETPIDGPQYLHRHPISCDLDATDEQLARLGLIVPAEAPPKSHEYTIDTDDEDDRHDSSSSSGGSASILIKTRLGASPDRMHSAQNHKFRKVFKFGKCDDPSTTPLNTVTENEEVGPTEKTTISDESLTTAATDSMQTISDKTKGKQKFPYPDDLHTSIPTKFITAKPRLSPMEYARTYYLAKEKFDEDGEECPLPRPEAYWAWTENHDKFVCIPKIPDGINRACFVTKLDEPAPDGGPRYIHTEFPSLRAVKPPRENKIRRAISNADLGLSRLREIATGSKNKLFGRAKAQTDEIDESETPVLPHIDVGGSRLSVGMFAIIRD